MTFIADNYILYKYTLRDTMEWLYVMAQHPWKTFMAALVLTGVYLLRLMRPSAKPGSKKTQNKVEYKDGIVYIHMFPRAFTKKVVNLSPYAIKVETWCRVNKIPYQVVETTKFSSKEGQIPYLIYNGQETADSSVIISILEKEFNVHPDEFLTEQQKGVERAVARMLDDSFAVLYFYYRYQLRKEEFAKCFKVTTAPKLLQSFIHGRIGNGMSKRARFQGFGRYGEKHMIDLGNNDLKAIDGILGNKPYLFGDSPSTLDAAVFAHLTQVVYPDMPYPWKTFIETECPKLFEYCERIRTTYWPDWDEIVAQGSFE